MEFPGLTKISEPKLLFEAFTQNAHHIHPLKGLIEYGPYSQKLTAIQK